MPSTQQRLGLETYIVLFNRLDEGELVLPDSVSAAIEFSDPFCTLQGREALAEYLQHFAEQVSQPRFEILTRAWDADICLLRWNFRGGLKKPDDWCFPGVSELHFDAAGRVVKHVDHWDSGRYFYARIPLLGWMIRRINAWVNKDRQP
ncbi:MAG: hypothetical protein ACI9W6_000904 [Motiliproteus sp.]|jgi:hypothetical protein